MRRFILASGLVSLVFAGFASFAEAGEAEHAVQGKLDCLSTGAAIEAVSRREAIAPQRAIGAARAAAPGADVLRASLCRQGDELAYRVTALRQDGRVVRVTVEAGSGKITSVH